jgi:hypothetical protein
LPRSDFLAEENLQHFIDVVQQRTKPIILQAARRRYEQHFIGYL